MLDVELVPGSSMHSHSIEEMNAGLLRPGEDCEECRGRPVTAVRVAKVDREKRTITVTSDEGDHGS